MASKRYTTGAQAKGFRSFLSALILLACLAVGSDVHARWNSKTAVDDITGEPFIVASSHARGSGSGDPTNQAIHVRCRAGKVDVYLEWGRPIDEDYGMRAQFDQHGPIGLIITRATHRNTVTIELTTEEQQRFLGLMKASNALAVRLHTWPGQPAQATFSLAGSNRAIGKVERFCSQARERRKQAMAAESALYEAQYKAAVHTAVQRHWIRPQGTPANVQCRVRIKKFPDGEVITAEVVDSCGSSALDESIIDAVYRASPLPRPKNSLLFARELTFEFSSR